MFSPLRALELDDRREYQVFSERDAAVEWLQLRYPYIASHDDGIIHELNKVGAKGMALRHRRQRAERSCNAWRRYNPTLMVAIGGGRIMKRTILITVSCLVLPFTQTALGASCADSEGPKSAVAGYVGAMKENRFMDAYDFVTTSMTDGESRDQWAATQKIWFQGGEVKITMIDTREAHGTTDDGECAKSAIVPNVMASSDRFNNQGITEFELYTVVKDGDAWKVDSQETLMSDDDVQKWFPGEKMPEMLPML